MQNNMISAFLKYREKRAQIKARQRVELEKELEPYLRIVGELINEAQNNGKRIQDIEYELGVRNRNLVYRAKRLAKGHNEPEPEPESSEELETYWQVLTVPGGFEAYIGTTFVGTVWVDDGQIVIPDEWADSENQNTYRKIIRRIHEIAEG